MRWYFLCVRTYVIVFNNMKLKSKENLNESKKTRERIKHLEEYYEEHINETLPENHHRADVTSLNRMLAYFDAVMAACATFLAIPLKNIEHEDNNLFSDFIHLISVNLIEYFVGFHIVLSVWENMNTRAIVIKRADDYVLAFVIFEILVTSFLPFSLALQGHYPHEKVSFLSTCVVLGILQVIDVSIVLYAIHSPNLLHVDLKNWTKLELRELTFIMLFRPLVSLFLLIIAGASVLVHYGVSWAFIALLIIVPLIRKFYWFVRRRIKHFEETEKNQFLEHFSKGNVPKERVEIMSDAAVAVVACILILEITGEGFPTREDVNKFGLSNKLTDMTSEFFTYIASFCLVSALWYVNHAVLHLIKTVNVIMLLFQKIFLSFCCLCPLAGSIVLRFAIKRNHESNIAIRYSAMIIFLSSIANFFIFLYGLLTGEKYFHKWASIKNFKINKRQQLYSLAKAINLPFWSLFCALGSLGSPTSSVYILYATFAAAPCFFFASKIILMNHVGKFPTYFLSEDSFSEGNKTGNTSKEKDLQTNSFSSSHLGSYVT
ncbi:endosomal/lysosomal proton channel TMEM175-like isoform X3 [Hydra vulgaris]|uniref:Endosomal/lysosomal proton channel TMEM175 n=1 Tax=Hydra vulgaris TaxID=6087 RepID=A0ABM4DAH7_HYDVU